MTSEGVKDFLSGVIDIAQKLEVQSKSLGGTVMCPEQVVFFDEMNTANILGLLKEVRMCAA